MSQDHLSNDPGSSSSLETLDGVTPLLRRICPYYLVQWHLTRISLQLLEDLEHGERVGVMHFHMFLLWAREYMLATMCRPGHVSTPQEREQACAWLLHEVELTDHAAIPSDFLDTFHAACRACEHYCPLPSQVALLQEAKERKERQEQEQEQEAKERQERA